MDVQKGDRIELVNMGQDPRTGKDDPDPMLPGSKGTVRGVVKLWDYGYQVQVEWDAEVGRSLCLVVPPDEFRIIERVMD